MGVAVVNEGIIIALAWRDWEKSWTWENSWWVGYDLNQSSPKTSLEYQHCNYISVLEPSLILPDCWACHSGVGWPECESHHPLPSSTEINIVRSITTPIQT